MEMYRKIEEIILEDAPIVPMVNHLFQMVYQPYVKGIEVNALGGPYIPMKKIWLKKEANPPHSESRWILKKIPNPFAFKPD